MKKGGLISILMPAFNAERHLSEAVLSVLDQTYTDWELLILDDCSTDATSTMIKGFKDNRIRVYRSPVNKGYLRSCNDLFNLTKGELITFLDADDTCPKERLSECHRVFNESEKIGFHTTDHARTDEKGNIKSRHRTKIDYGRYASDPDYYPTICCATVMVRRELLKEVGGYSIFFDGIGGEDYHWLFKLALQGKGRHLDKELYHYRTHAGQLHENNTNPLKYFAADIDREIRHELITNRNDLLQYPDELRTKWEAYISTHPDELAFRKANWLLNRGRRKDSFLQAISMVSVSPFSVSTWSRFAYLCYSILMR